MLAGCTRASRANSAATERDAALSKVWAQGLHCLGYWVEGFRVRLVEDITGDTGKGSCKRDLQNEPISLKFELQRLGHLA